MIIIMMMIIIIMIMMMIIIIMIIIIITTIVIIPRSARERPGSGRRYVVEQTGNVPPLAEGPTHFSSRRRRAGSQVLTGTGREVPGDAWRVAFHDPLGRHVTSPHVWSDAGRHVHTTDININIYIYIYIYIHV